MVLRSFFVASLLLLSLVPFPVLSSNANVFVYHRFGDSRYPTTNTDISTFRSHLELLKNNRFVVLTLGEVVNRLREGRELPERCAVITIDDAYKSFLTGAMPLLRSFGYSATLFVSTRFVGNYGYLDWDEIRSLADEGIEIGNHSAAHQDYLTTLGGIPFDDWKKFVLDDLDEAAQIFRKEMNAAPVLYAYPYGEYSPELIRIVMEAGFHGAAAQISGVVDEKSDLFVLPRFPMGGIYGESSAFREKLFMRPLHVEALSASSPIWEGENPPELLIRILDDDIRFDGLRCYVSGKKGCEVSLLSGEGKVYRVRTKEPISVRRSRYTVTAPQRGGGWRWFSHLWVDPKR